MAKNARTKPQPKQNDESEIIFAEGLRVFEPHQNAPAFVKVNVIVSLNEFFKFAKEHPELQTEYEGKKQIKLQLRESKEGVHYFIVDTFVPEHPVKGKGKATPKTAAEVTEPIDDLPF